MPSSSDQLQRLANGLLSAKNCHQFAGAGVLTSLPWGNLYQYLSSYHYPHSLDWRNCDYLQNYLKIHLQNVEDMVVETFLHHLDHVGIYSHMARLHNG
jgi:hypothetical protein